MILASSGSCRVAVTCGFAFESLFNARFPAAANNFTEHVNSNHAVPRFSESADFALPEGLCG